MRSIKLSIVIPCYNEAENIPLILERFQSVISRDDIEVILVDNNSKDNSAEVLKKNLPHFSFARTIFEPVAGYGRAVLAGLRAAQGEYLGWTHGDLQTPPSDVLKALIIIEAENNPQSVYAKGWRRSRPLFDEFFTFGMSVFESLYFRRRLADINAQPNIFHRSFFESWINPPEDFALDLFVLYQAKIEGLAIRRFPVVFPKRLYGESSWNTGLAAKWKFIKRTFSFSRELKKRFKK